MKSIKMPSKSALLRSSVAALVIGWLGAIASVFFHGIKTYWFAWVVPLTIVLFLYVFIHPFGMPDNDLPTEEEIKRHLKESEGADDATK